MEIFDIQIMLKDGSLAPYQVQNERDSDIYKVFEQEKHVASFTASKDGSWNLNENPGNIDEDLEHRLVNQLNGLRY
jgi:hypothetical protein